MTCHRRIPLFAALLLCWAAPALALEGDLGGTVSTVIGGRAVELPLMKTDLSAEIEGDLATVTVVQSFLNPAQAPVNATYLFPLPEEAAVYGMEMRTGDEVVTAVIHRREEARATYEAAKAEGRNAALLNQLRPNIFSQEIANLMPGKPITVTLRYVQAAPKIDGAYELVMPLVVGPRYLGPQTAAAASRDDAGPARPGQWNFQPLPEAAGSQRADLPAAIEPERVSIRLHLKAGLPIVDAASRTHALTRRDLAADEAEFALSAGRTIDNRDFVFRYALAGADSQAGFLTHQDETGGTFSLLIEPPAVPAEASITPREMVFLLDCSGSMSGQPLEASRAFMTRALTGLRPTDSFRIIRFSDAASEFTDRPLPATPDNIARGIEYARSLNSEGGTNMASGISQALAGAPPAGTQRIVVFLTDGYIGDEATILGMVAGGMGDARLYAFGVGSSVNRFLMTALGRAGRGFSRFMDPTESVDAVASELAARLQSPVLTDIAIDWGRFKPTDLTIDRIPDLFAGQSIRIQGRYEAPADGQILLRGKVRGQPATLPVTLRFNPAGQGSKALPLIWARSTIEAEMDKLMAPQPLRPNHESDREIEETVTALGLSHSLMTQWTAFVAVSSRIANAVPQVTADAAVPLPLPAGMQPQGMPAPMAMAQPAQSTPGGGFSGSSTPEPATWAALLLLLAMAGWQLRRRSA